MKRIALFFLVLALALPCFGITAAAQTDISAKSAAVIDGDSGELLYAKNENSKLGMASTTKIMTALTVIECGDLDTVFEVDERAVGAEGTSVYLKKGDKVSSRDLLYALMLQSANDAAEALAYRYGGGIEAFAEMMNGRAAEMGLMSTRFTNPHGLYDKDHFTTAYELALITREAMKNELFREIVSTKNYSFETDSGKRNVVNHNRLLFSYEGCIGVKTGYTKATGRCLVSAVQRDGRTLICVTLDCPDDWNTHKKLLDTCFERQALS